MEPRHGDTDMQQVNRTTEKIIGCAIEVHRILRTGLYEAVYRTALATEFDAAHLRHAREVRVPAVYKGRQIGNYRIDFVVEDLVVVEVKSVEQLHSIFETQVVTYLRVAKKRVGLLINFNSRLLKDGVKRLVV